MIYEAVFISIILLYSETNSFLHQNIGKMILEMVPLKVELHWTAKWFILNITNLKIKLHWTANS
jgi:hypothetical protein